MKCNLCIVLILTGTLASCSTSRPQTPTSAEPEVPTSSATLWGGRTELFMERPELVRGETAGFAVHLTDLRTYRPLAEGLATIEFEKAGVVRRFESSKPSRPGVFRVDVRLDDGLEEVLVCRGRAHIEGDAGDLVSLLPWGGPVDGIRTSGLKWPLNGESLLPEKTRGVSNEMLGGSVTIDINSGLLLIIHRRQTQAENRATETERTP